MILYVNYEELTALRSGAHALLQGEDGGECAVLAPTEERARVEAFMSRLEGDISVSTLDELRTVEKAILAIVECLRVEMDTAVLATHAAHEGAVAAYFDYAHGLTVVRRIDAMASEMAALIELVTGEAPTPETSRSFRFPD